MAHNPDKADRFCVVRRCQCCDRGLIREEVEAHRLSHLSPRVRRLAGTALRLTPTEQQELCDWLAEG